MTWMERLLVFALGGLLFAPAARAINDGTFQERNYQAIIDRNPFGLKPPPPPPTNALPIITPPKDKIFLTGITSIGALRAYFMAEPAPANKEPPKYYSLGVDEKRDGLEVLDINPTSGSVKVRNSGIELVMTFAEHGVKPPATPAGPLPTIPGARPGLPPVPGAAPATGTAANVGVNAAVPRTTGRIRTIPSRNLRTTPVPQPAPADVQPNPDAAVQDVLLMELQKRSNPDVPFPPTPLPQ